MTGPLAFVKRPVQIQAWQLTYDADWEAIATWCGGRLVNTEVADSGEYETDLVIHTLEGDMFGSLDDWIIRGVAGEFYPCKPDIFDATYSTAGDPITASTARIADEIADGRRRAHAKHGDTSIEGSSSDLWFLAILTEEVGEAAAALNDHRHDPAYPLATNLRDELVDSAVVAVAWIAAIDARVGAAE